MHSWKFGNKELFFFGGFIIFERTNKFVMYESVIIYTFSVKLCNPAFNKPNVFKVAVAFTTMMALVLSVPVYEEHKEIEQYVSN